MEAGERSAPEPADQAAEDARAAKRAEHAAQLVKWAGEWPEREAMIAKNGTVVDNHPAVKRRLKCWCENGGRHFMLTDEFGHGPQSFDNTATVARASAAASVGFASHAIRGGAFRTRKPKTIIIISADSQCHAEPTRPGTIPGPKKDRITPGCKTGRETVSQPATITTNRYTMCADGIATALGKSACRVRRLRGRRPAWKRHPAGSVPTPAAGTARSKAAGKVRTAARGGREPPQRGLRPTGTGQPCP